MTHIQILSDRFVQMQHYFEVHHRIKVFPLKAGSDYFIMMRFVDEADYLNIDDAWNAEIWETIRRFYPKADATVWNILPQIKPHHTFTIRAVPVAGPDEPLPPEIAVLNTRQARLEKITVVVSTEQFPHRIVRIHSPHDHKKT